MFSEFINIQNRTGLADTVFFIKCLVKNHIILRGLQQISVFIVYIHSKSSINVLNCIASHSTSDNKHYAEVNYYFHSVYNCYKVFLPSTCALAITSLSDFFRMERLCKSTSTLSLINTTFTIHEISLCHIASTCA